MIQRLLLLLAVLYFSLQARYSPRSLELQLRAGLSVLETLEEGMRQVDNVSSTRAVALAQQETVALAQLMKVEALMW